MILIKCLLVHQEVCVFINMLWFRVGLTNNIGWPEVTFSLTQDVDHQSRPETRHFIYLSMFKEVDCWIIFFFSLTLMLTTKN